MGCIQIKKIYIALIMCFLWLTNNILSAQRVLTTIPREPISADSLAHLVYDQNNPDRTVDQYDIGNMRKFGWLKMSQKMNTDSFFYWTKQYCIDRVGESFFYQHFRLDLLALRDNTNTEIYEVRYIFLPFDTAAIVLNEDSTLFVNFTFKSFDFLGIHEIQTPEYLPDCRLASSNCQFLFDRTAVLKIAEEKGIKSAKGYPPYLELQPDLNWRVTINENDWLFHQYFVNSMTGAVSETKTSRRID